MDNRYRTIMEEVKMWMGSKKLDTKTKIQMWNILKEERKKNEQIFRDFEKS